MHDINYGSTNGGLDYSVKRQTTYLWARETFSQRPSFSLDTLWPLWPLNKKKEKQFIYKVEAIQVSNRTYISSRTLMYYDKY